MALEPSPNAGTSYRSQHGTATKSRNNSPALVSVREVSRVGPTGLFAAGSVGNLP
jgi:hypothetical protein